MSEHQCPVCSCGYLCYGKGQAKGIIFCDTCLTYFRKEIKNGEEVLVEDG
jgi:hypothetical protein